MNQEHNLAHLLDRNTVEGILYRKMPGGLVCCFACGHKCQIKKGNRGACLVRFNQNGELKVPYGYVSSVACDPIEKKPFFHVLPGSSTLSFGMLGCDYRCDFCQNWITSQTLRDPKAVFPIEQISSKELIEFADRFGARIITSTYNEPLITSEWAIEIFKLARKKGMLTSYVSNANATPEVLEYLRPWLDLYKVDLKCFSEENYRRVIGGKLGVVLDTIKRLVDMKFWVEVVTLIIPGFNDSEDEISRMAGFLAEVSCEIPWHLTAFHQEYKMTETPNTPAGTLVRACEIGKRAGLKFVYAGNLSAEVGNLENTHCPQCNEAVVERRGFSVLKNTIQNGKCPRCNSGIPGIWDLPYN